MKVNGLADREMIAALTPGFTGADLEDLTRRAGMIAIRARGAEVDQVTGADFRTALADSRVFIIANQADGYGIDQCLDIVQGELKKGNGVKKPDGEEWLEGSGLALAMLECGPPTEHRSSAEMKLSNKGKNDFEADQARARPCFGSGRQPAHWPGIGNLDVDRAAAVGLSPGAQGRSTCTEHPGHQPGAQRPRLAARTHRAAL